MQTNDDSQRGSQHADRPARRDQGVPAGDGAPDQADADALPSLLPPSSSRDATRAPAVADSRPRFVVKEKNKRKRVDDRRARADAAIARNLRGRAASEAQQLAFGRGHEPQ